MSKDQWQKVGVIGVDAGMCWIGDPCYVLHREDRPKYEDIGKSWREFCREVEKRGIDGPTCAAQFNFDKGHPGVGVCTRTGPGDGEYDVFVRKAADGRMLEVKVVFEEE